MPFPPSPEFTRHLESAARIVADLSNAEKASLLAGVDAWHLRDIPRWNIPSIMVTDCGHGVTLCGERSSPSTCFPTGIGMASTWNETLLEEAGRAIGRETRALGCSMLLGPKVNLHRLPLNGRSFETFSEDPVLAGRLGGAVIRGIQSTGVAACLKAITANNQQKHQEKISAEVDERTLRELYLRAFEIATETGQPRAIMTSYNSLNGVLTSESSWLLQDIVKGEWQFPGLIVSDWRAVRTTKVYGSGLDLEMPGPGKFLNTQAVLNALADGQLSEADLDDKSRRIIAVLLEYGQPEDAPVDIAALLDTPENRAAALRVAEESIVLLKNERSTLPFDRASMRRLLVVGPNAAEARLGGGGSASVTPFYTISPLEGIRELAGGDVQVQYIEGCSLVGTMAPVQDGLEHTDDSGQTVPGLRAGFFNNGDPTGTPDASWAVPEVNFSWGWAAPGPGVLRADYAARFSGRIVPPTTGRYRFGVYGQEGCIRLHLGDELVIDEWKADPTFEDAYVTRYKVVEAELTAGVPIEIVVEYGKRAARGAVRLEWEIPGRPNPLENAIAAAGQADAVVVCAGLSNLFEGGSRDRENIDLPEAQQRLIEAMAAANPRTVVALFNGGPLAMPWEPQVAALLEAWYPGQEGGRALARILFGEINPSGHLPDTLARRLDDHAAAQNYPGDGNQVFYKEGVFVGYRHFDSAGIAPHYPFGFGLSYTTFAVSSPELGVSTLGQDSDVVVRATVTNTGRRTGKAVVQCYVRHQDAPVPRPDKELRRFQKVELAAGQSQEIQFSLGTRDLAFYDTIASRWSAPAGRYEISVGEHSRSLQGTVLTLDADL